MQNHRFFTQYGWFLTQCQRKNACLRAFFHSVRLIPYTKAESLDNTGIKAVL